MKFYIASALENHASVSLAATMLKNAGHTHTYDWTEHGSVQRDGDARIAEVAANEIAGVWAADVVIVLLPGGRGTHTELGVAIGAGKQVHVHGPMLDASGRTCAFYHAPNVTRHYGSIVTMLAAVNA